MNVDRFDDIKIFIYQKTKNKIKREKNLGIHLWYVLQRADR